MSIGDLYAAISTNVASTLVLIVIMLYLAARDHIVGGQRYQEMVDDRNYWRDRYLATIGELTPRLEQIAELDDIEVSP